MADPVGLVYAAARRHRREMLQNERGAASQMVRYYGQSWQRIQAQLDEFQRRIAEAKAAGEDVSPSWLFQLGRLETLRAQVEAEIGRFAQYAESGIIAQQRAAVEAAERHALDWTTTVPGVAVEWNRLPTGAVEDLVGFLSNGSPLRELLNELPQDAGQDVADALVAGVATGQNPRATARLVRRALGGNLARALAISRTETMRAYREATRRSYLANRDVLKGWVWHSALDKRTCACCWAMHGSVHRLSENLDDHVNGRCAMIPLIKGWPNPDIEAGADVFDRQPEEVQRAVLGDAGLEAYKAGAVTLGDYVGQTRSRKWGTMRSARSLTAIVGADEARKWRETAAINLAAQAAPAGMPTGTLVRVSDTLDFDASLDPTTALGAATREAVAAIESVMDVPQLPVIRVSSSHSRHHSGAYYRTSLTNQPGYIEVSVHGPTPTRTTVHEIGHFIDHGDLGVHSGFASESSPELDGWRDALHQSATYQALKTQSVVSGRSVSGRVYTYNDPFYTYLLQERECFARSFAQYIGLRSGNAEMQAELDAARSGATGADPLTIWPDDDFDDIAAALDAVLTKLGLRK